MKMLFKTLWFMGFPDYGICTDGSVWSYKSGSWKRMNPGTQKSGHKNIQLMTRRHRRKWFGVHQLVMLAFVGPCPEGKEICHYPDPNPANNRWDNLIYGTHRTNASHVRKEIYFNGENHANAWLSDDEVAEIRLMRSKGYTCKKIGEKFHVSGSWVSVICRFKARTK